MSATVLYMSTSLDGFIAGPNETPENGLGDGGHRLHQWSPNPDPDRKVTSGYLDDLRQWPLVSYLSDVTSAMTQAKEAAGDKNVMVQGAGTAHLAIAAGVLDELELHVIPVLFGQGRRLFEGLAAEQIELERTRVLEGEGGVTHMHYRVRR